MGKCPDCGAWDALEKYVEPKVGVGATADHAPFAAAWTDPAAASEAAVNAPRALPLPEIEIDDLPRIETGIAEFDRVLGGGVVPGSVILVGGDPGIGKSTLLLQASGRLAARNVPVLYVSSEESAHQTRLRGERLFGGGAESLPKFPPHPRPPQGGGERSGPIALSDLNQLHVLAETNLARIIEQARAVRPRVMVVDSIQMLFRSDIEAAPGSIAQLRRCCMELVYLAKISGMSVVLVGHVTKEGALAGPKLLEHLVDTVLSFEGDRHHAHRVVRATKNRFGTTLEVALFEMTGEGLREVPDGATLVEEGAGARPGSVICPAMHGSRCLLVELQALTAPGFPGTARRKASGLDANRLAMLIAVLEKHGGLRLSDQDIFASTTGGLRVAEPAADLALCLAIAGAHLRRALEPATAVIGEVGLGGEIRRTSAVEQRVREAERLGHRRIVVPARHDGSAALKLETAVELIPVETISAAIEMLGPTRDAGRARSDRTARPPGGGKPVG
jgi:DNA repair protein RadA/Sms